MRKTTSLITTRFHTISKLESLEEYYLKLLQLHMSWQDENQLKECHQSYEEKYMEVIYSKLNDAQKCFFSCIITYITKCKTTFKNNDIWLVELEWRKSFLINVINEYVKRNLKYRVQKLE